MNEPKDKTDDGNSERKWTEQTGKQPSGSCGVGRSGRRAGRKPAKVNARAKLERSRQSARECRARKKMRYQYLEELMANREKAIYSLREELETHKRWCIQMDAGQLPADLVEFVAHVRSKQKHTTTKAETEQGPSCLEQQNADIENLVMKTPQQNEPSSSTSMTGKMNRVYTATSGQLPTFLDDV